MIVNNKRNSVKDRQAQGDRLGGAEDSIDDTSPKKKRSRRLPGRSKSLADATGSNRKPADGNRNMGRYAQSYLRRAPTQDDIYKILSDTSDSIRPSTGELKRLSPYVPLPAIGTKFRPLKEGDSKVPETLDSSSVTSCDDGNQKLVREGTYNVLKPKFVKGPVVSDGSRNVADHFEESDNKEPSKKAVDQAKVSFTTIVFGPRLREQIENVIEEELTVTEFPDRQLHANPSATNSNTNIQTNGSATADHINSIPMQKLYYRDVQKNDRQWLGQTELSAHKGTSDKSGVEQALWFD